MKNFVLTFFWKGAWCWLRSEAKLEVKGPSVTVKEHGTLQDLMWSANPCVSWLSVVLCHPSTIFWLNPLVSCWCSVKPAQPSWIFLDWALNICGWIVLMKTVAGAVSLKGLDQGREAKIWTTGLSLSSFLDLYALWYQFLQNIPINIVIWDFVRA